MIKKLFSFIFIIFSLLIASCSGANTGNASIESNDPLTGNSSTLVAYFSWSGAQNTKTMADYITEFTGGEQFRIIPKTPYTTNYNEVIDVAQEEKNANARPELAESLSEETLSNYDVIFLGYPIWWYDAPMIIYTFLEGHDFTNKTIVPFATSGGSGLQEEDKFRQITDATVLDGLCISHFSDNASNKNRVQEWIEQLGYSKDDSAIDDGDSMENIKMAFNGEEITVELTDNSATRDLLSRIKNGGMTLSFSDYAGNEKIASPNPPLDITSPAGYDPVVGDLLIYIPWNNICAFYRDSSSYSSSLLYLGHILDDGIEKLAAQEGEFSVTFSIA